MIEIIRRKRPAYLVNELRIRLNDASDDFCDETEILEGQWRFSTASGQMYYTLPEDCVGVKQADLGTQLMNRRVGGIDTILIQD